MSYKADEPRIAVNVPQQAHNTFDFSNDVATTISDAKHGWEMSTEEFFSDPRRIVCIDNGKLHDMVQIQKHVYVEDHVPYAVSAISKKTLVKKRNVIATLANHGLLIFQHKHKIELGVMSKLQSDELYYKHYNEMRAIKGATKGRNEPRAGRASMYICGYSDSFWAAVAEYADCMNVSDSYLVGIIMANALLAWGLLADQAVEDLQRVVEEGDSRVAELYEAYARILKS